MNHMPWDFGSINDALDKVIGFHHVNKTVKTLCGKRVSTNLASHKHPITCEACKLVMDDEKLARETPVKFA